MCQHNGQFDSGKYQDCVTFLLNEHMMDGNSLEFFSDEVGESVELIGTDYVSEDYVRQALDYGYCWDCICEACTELVEANGIHAILSYDGSGFVYAETFKTWEAQEAEWQRLEFAFLSPQWDEDGFVNVPATGKVSASFGTESLGEFDTQGNAEKALRSAMDKANYWPNVWRVNERGDATLLVFDPESQSFKEASQ